MLAAGCTPMAVSDVGTGAVDVTRQCFNSPRLIEGAFLMSRQIIYSMIGAGAMLVGTASEASAFEMLGRMLGGGYYGGPGCGCAAEPSCGCGPSWGGCGCGRRHCGLFGGGLFSRHRGCDSGCGCAAEPVCGCAAEPACGCAAEPVCGCAAEPSCGCASGCDSGCGRRHCGLFGGGLFGRHRGCGCGGSSCCEPVCGCAAEPVCGCAG